jgi:hypothetical protein
MPRIVETSDTFYFVLHPKKKRIDRKLTNTWLRVYVLDGIVTANGEFGICGSRSSSCYYKTTNGTYMGAERQQLVSPGTCCKQFQFQFWSFELASSWAPLDAECCSHDLAESEPLITTALATLPPKRPTVARAGCVADTRSNNEHIARSLDGLPSLAPLSVFATDIFPKLQVDVNERVNLPRVALASSVTSPLSTTT